jgi:tetratricopeptide (TPR) repeat protein
MSCSSPSEQTTEDVPTVIGLTSVQKLDRQIESNPEKPSLYMERGDLYFELEGFDEAIADYKKVIALDSSILDAHTRLADTYLAYDNSRLALRTLEAASYQFPKNLSLLHKLAEFQIILKQNNDAFTTLQRATKIDRFDPKTYYMMGVNFQDIEDEEKAIRSYKLAIEKDPDFIDALMRLGYIYEQKEDPIAMKYYDNAIAVDPDLFDAYMAKGNFLGMQGKFPEAIEVFQEITDRSGKRNPSAFFNIGLAYYQMDSLVQAKKHFKITSDLDQTYGLAYYYQGVVAEQEGNIDEAKKQYMQATSFDESRKRADQALEALK